LGSGAVSVGQIRVETRIWGKKWGFLANYLS
jgi:hypothetical protein